MQILWCCSLSSAETMCPSFYNQRFCFFGKQKNLFFSCPLSVCDNHWKAKMNAFSEIRETRETPKASRLSSEPNNQWQTKQFSEYITRDYKRCSASMKHSSNEANQVHLQLVRLKRLGRQSSSVQRPHSAVQLSWRGVTRICRGSIKLWMLYTFWMWTLIVNTTSRSRSRSGNNILELYHNILQHMTPLQNCSWCRK